jgi:hypothetical protein
MQMFEQQDVKTEIEKRLRVAGLDPADPKVDAITSIVSRYFAERTAEVLARVNEVLGQITPGELH